MQMTSNASKAAENRSESPDFRKQILVTENQGAIHGCTDRICLKYGARQGQGPCWWLGRSSREESTWPLLKGRHSFPLSLFLTSAVLARLPTSWSGNIKNHRLPAACLYIEALWPGSPPWETQHPGTSLSDVFWSHC